jgi:hypothetical protein
MITLAHDTYIVTADTRNGVASQATESASAASRLASVLMRANRTVYVTAPNGEVLPGKDFVAEVTHRALKNAGLSAEALVSASADELLQDA